MQNAVNWKPEKTGFMDAAMRRLWNQFDEMPEDLRLYGGTALALYLDHRTSTDFDFATPTGTVERELVQRIPALRGGEVRGGGSMVDVVISGERDVMVTMMECGRLIPMPICEPITADNGVRVAHPVDLVAGKVHACVSRGARRDYEDIAAAARTWHRWTLQGVKAVIEKTSYDAAWVARALAEPSPEAELGSRDMGTLRRFARRLPEVLIDRRPER